MEFIELLGNLSIVSIILFLVGIGLIIAEMFEPGFGILGASGIVCLVIFVFLTAQTIMQGVILTAILFVILIILLFIFLALVSKRRLPKNLILRESTSAEQGFSGTEDMRHLLGRSGTTVTICRPAGNADFDGVRLDVVTRGEFIEKGTAVEVVEIEGCRIVVKAVY